MVENVFNRTNWTNIVVAVDVTGSMQPYAAAVYQWIRQAHEKFNTIKYYVFFNDGDKKPTSLKEIGTTEGSYGIGGTDLYTILEIMKTAIRDGNDGDERENVSELYCLVFVNIQPYSCSR